MKLYNTDEAVKVARLYAEDNMTAQVRIARMNAPKPDAVVAGQWDADEMFDVYVGKARVYSVSGPMTMTLGGAPMYSSSTYVSIPLVEVDTSTEPVTVEPLSPRVDDVVEVLSDADPLMVLRHFRVTDVDAGGQFPVVRRMQVVGIQASRQWGSPDVPTEWIIS